MNLEYDETYILLNVPALFINLDFSLNHKFKATTHQSVSPQSLLAKKVPDMRSLFDTLTLILNHF